MNPVYMNSLYEYEYNDRNYDKNNDHIGEVYEVHIKIGTSVMNERRIHSLPNYKIRFSTTQDVSKVKGVGDITVVKKEKLLPMYDFFIRLPSNEHIPYIIMTFKYLLDSFDILHNHHIDVTNYSGIGFRWNSTPVIYDFNENTNLPPYLVPIEMYLLNKIKHDEKNAFSYKNIRDMVRKYCMLTSRSLDNKEIERITEFFYPLVNQPKTIAVSKLSEYRSKWYIYGLSSVFTNLVFMLDNCVVPSCLQELFSNCGSVLPNERPTSAEVKQMLSQYRTV